MKNLFLLAFEKIKGNKRYFWGYYLLQIVSSIGFLLIAALVVASLGLTSRTVQHPFLTKIAVDFLVFVPMVVMLGVINLLAIDVAFGRVEKANTLARVFPRIKPLLLIGVFFIAFSVVHVFLMESDFFGFIPMIIISVLLAFLIMPLVFSIMICVDQKVGAVEAVTVAYSRIWDNVIRVYSVIISALFIEILGTVLTIGIGMIWLFPWFIQVNALLYRDLFYPEKK